MMTLNELKREVDGLVGEGYGKHNVAVEANYEDCGCGGGSGIHEIEMLFVPVTPVLGEDGETLLLIA